MRVRPKNPYLHVFLAIAAGVGAYSFADASESVRVILGLLAFAVFSIQGDLMSLRKHVEGDI